MATALRLTSRRLLRPRALARFQSTLTVPGTAATPPPPQKETDAPLSRLPTSSLVRALMLHQITSRPSLLSLGSKVMLKTADRIDSLAPLKWVVDKSFYAHFCAGSTPAEIATTMSYLRSLGYSGIILNYAREVEHAVNASTAAGLSEIAQWREGQLRTIALTSPGDFVAMKLSGAGSLCLPLLEAQRPCTDVSELIAALDEICAAAAERGVGLLVDAEQAALQQGVDKWTLHYMRKFNTGRKAVVYNTYQMYLKRSTGVLEAHLKQASQEGWRLGVKLVRGAYLHTDPRELIHDTKAHTDAAYDEAADMLIKNGVDTVVASHNKESVTKALHAARGREKDGMLVFAQLMGMADDLSLSLVGRAQVLKYAVWGSTGECVKYLLRRAEENREAVGRSEESYCAVVNELKRRFGMSA